MRCFHFQTIVLILINLSIFHSVNVNGYIINGFDGYIEKSMLSPNGSALEYKWFPQKLDHFTACNEIWKQRYLDEMMYHKDSGPIFLYIEGEQRLEIAKIEKANMANLAKKYNAAMFALEHRFYGESKPKPDLSVESLKYLSSSQALADLAYFILKMNQEHNFSNSKWIVFGGSYPGALAAWLRYKYSHLVYAAVSSSAPLLYKFHYPEYMETVLNSLDTVNPKCFEAIRSANQILIEGVTNSTQRKHYEKLFKLCHPLDDHENIAMFFSWTSGIFATVVQYDREKSGTDEDSEIINIKDVCSIMTDEQIKCPVHRLAAVVKFFLTVKKDDRPCKRFESLTNSSYVETKPDRQWLWQTCTEFGNAQTVGSTNNLFGVKETVKLFYDRCADNFGPSFNETFISQSVEETNMKYGAQSLPVTRVIFVHGTIDPWSPLGITKNPPEGSYAIFINGTSHCADLRNETKNDPPQLVEARSKISEIIGNWLSGK